MIGRTHERFWKHFEVLPGVIQKLAREKYALWQREPFHPSLKFEERRNGICVVRIGDHHRALGLRRAKSWPGFGSARTPNTIVFDSDLSRSILFPPPRPDPPCCLSYFLLCTSYFFCAWSDPAQIRAS